MDVEVDVVVWTPEATSLVYEGGVPLEVEIETHRMTLYPGALLTLPVVGDVKALVSGGVLRRLGDG